MKEVQNEAKNLMRTKAQADQPSITHTNLLSEIVNQECSEGYAMVHALALLLSSLKFNFVKISFFVSSNLQNFIGR